MVITHSRNLIKVAMRNYPMIFNPLWAAVYPYVIRRDEKYFGHEYTDRNSAFTQIFDENRWLSGETRSGRGSTLDYTKTMRKGLEECLRKLSVRIFLDAPCGDFNWMQNVTLPDTAIYIGGDIVKPLTAELQRLYGCAKRSFHDIDIVESPLPKADLWLCRDVLFHLPNEDIVKVLRRFAKSAIPYLLTTLTPSQKKSRRKARRLPLYQSATSAFFAAASFIMDHRLHSARTAPISWIMVPGASIRAFPVNAPRCIEQH
jgi:hypothetical protein